MFKTPRLDFIHKRDINETNDDPLLDIDAVLADENWEILKRSEDHAVYRKTCTEYDIIDVSHKKTIEGQHIFYVSVPMITTKYAYSTSISGSQNMFNYMCTFIEHYSHARAHSQALDANMRLSKL
jgi:hypothetical protein